MKELEENCPKIWVQTIDRKFSDLSVREVDQAELCR